MLEIHPLQLASVWEKVKPYIEDTRKRSNESWTAEHVFAAIFTGRASLFVHDRGILVTEIVQDAFSPTQYLNVWIVAGEFDAMPIRETVVSLYKSRNCTHVRFVGRKGWEKKLGLQPKAVIYEAKDG